MTKKTLLCLDPSSDHLAWSIVSCEGKDALITNCGMLYATSSWELGHRLWYMNRGIRFLVDKFQAQTIVTEMFEMPRGRQQGISVIPTINNNLKILGYEQDIEVFEYPVPSWRKELNISGIPALDKKGQLIKTKSGRPKKDFKVPTKLKVEEFLDIKIPEKLFNNSDLKLRAVPYDITDCLAISIAYLIKNRYNSIKSSPNMFENTELLKKLYTMRKKV